MALMAVIGLRGRDKGNVRGETRLLIMPVEGMALDEVPEVASIINNNIRSFYKKTLNTFRISHVDTFRVFLIM